MTKTESTPSNPFGFFRYFFTGLGFEKYRKVFFYEFDELSELEMKEFFGDDRVMEINKEEEFIVYVNDDGIEVKKYFRDELENHLNTQKIISCNLIDNQIKSIRAVGGNNSLYFQSIIDDDLPPIIQRIKSDQLIKKYDINIQIIYSILIDLKNNNPLLFTQINSPIILKDKNGKTFKTEFTSEKLKIIRDKLMQNGIIESISEVDFLYLFSEKPINSNTTRIFWKESFALCYRFLQRIVFTEKEFNMIQTNTCIQFKNDRMLDSHDKPKNNHHVDSILNPILSF